MSKETKILKIKSSYYQENGEAVFKYTSPTELLHSYIIEIEKQYEAENNNLFKNSLDNILIENRKNNYLTSEYGFIYFDKLEEYIDIVEINEIKNLPPDDFTTKKTTNKKKPVEKYTSLKSTKNITIINTLKSDFKKSNSSLHPFLSPNFNFFILSNSRFDNILRLITSLTSLINQKIGDFFITIEKRDKDNNIIEENTYPNKQLKGQKMSSNKKNITKSFYNKIIFGPTGTGKSHLCNNIKDSMKINPDSIFRTTFYEDYSYYDFFGQYKPIVLRNTSSNITVPTYNNKNKTLQIAEHRITYQFVPGIFFKALIKALFLEDVEGGEVLLIIEEINRGNCSSIFGDIFQLLDRDPTGKSSYSLSLSDDLKRYLLDVKYDITSISKQDTEYNPFQLAINSEYIVETLEQLLKEDHLYIPKNLKIIGTMNTSDQSLFPMDSAFKRRWDMEYSYINYKEESLKNVLIEDTSSKWLDVLKDVNDLIFNKTNSEDKQIGQWFLKDTNGIILEDDFKNKLISYLYFDVFKHFPEVFNHSRYSDLVSSSAVDLINLIKKNNTGL